MNGPSLESWRVAQPAVTILFSNWPVVSGSSSAEMQLGGSAVVEMERQESIAEDKIAEDTPQAAADAGSEGRHGEQEGSEGRGGKGRAARDARASGRRWPFLRRSPASRARSNLAKFRASSPPVLQSPRGQWSELDERPRDTAKTGARMESGSESEASSALVRASDVRGSEDLLVWAQRLPRRRNKKLDEASACSSLYPSMGKRLIKPILCFILPPLRHWGPFL